MKRFAVLTLAILFVLVAAVAPAHAQAARLGKLIVTVVDQTGAVIPNATVKIVGLDAKTKDLAFEPQKSNDGGIATFERLVQGRYSIQGEFPGFDLGLLRDIPVKAGDNKRVLVLPLQKFNQEVTVGREAQAAASDRASTFGSALTREQVESLSDDPDEMQRQLNEMSGGGATIRVDSFEGQRLPPKAQIKSIHITRDMFAAENHSAGGMFIDIITQPGMGQLRGSTNFRFADSALDGRNPLIPKKGPSQTRGFNGYIGGALIKDKSSFSISAGATNSYRTPSVYAQTAAGKVAQNLDMRTPSNSYNVSGLFDYALTKDQTLRISVNNYSYSTDNQGVGNYNLAERAYSSTNSSGGFRFQEAGPIGRRFFINTRFYLGWLDSSSQSVLEAPTIIVQDSYISGGAQTAGGTHSRNFTLNSDLDYVRGINSWRFGIQLDGARYRSDETRNYLGTYTFAPIDPANPTAPLVPILYTQRIGDPRVSYWNLNAGFYVQDDIRIRKNLTLSPGVRIEAQTHMHDLQNIGPRFGITWSPWKSGKTTLRGSGGIFYDWLSTGTYEQTLRMNGINQQQVSIRDPGYPDPGPLVGAPTDLYLISPDLQFPRTVRWSAGIDESITKTFRIGLTYANSRGNGLFVGENLNLPVNGVYPNPAFKNIIQVIGEGRSRSQSLSTFFSWSLAPMMPGMTSSGPRFSWKRGLSIYGSYGIGKSENNTDGAFSYPATGTIATEWGPSSGDTRHRVNVSLSSGFLKNFSGSINFSAYSGNPYNMRIPVDRNGDFLLNDRPVGVGRNTLRATAQWYSYGYFNYAVGLGKRKVTGGQGFTATMGGAQGISISQVNIPDQSRYRLVFTVMVNNLTNHANYSGYSGLIGSPFYMKPTSVDGVRTANLSVGFTF